LTLDGQEQVDGEFPSMRIRASFEGDVYVQEQLETSTAGEFVVTNRAEWTLTAEGDLSLLGSVWYDDQGARHWAFEYIGLRQH
jgi:hypothetical protein